MEISIPDINAEAILIADVKRLIADAKQRIATIANAGITTLYWQIGERINRDVLDYKRAEYGKRIVSTLSTQLQYEYGGNEYSERNLRRMMQLATEFPNPKIVSTLSTQLS